MNHERKQDLVRRWLEITDLRMHLRFASHSVCARLERFKKIPDTSSFGVEYQSSTEKENGDSVEVNVYRNNSWIGSPVVIGRDAT